MRTIKHYAMLSAMLFGMTTAASALTRDNILGSYFMRYRFCVENQQWRTSASSVDITAGKGDNEIQLTRFANDQYPAGGYFDPATLSIVINKQKVNADNVDYYLESFSAVKGNAYEPTDADIVLSRDEATGIYSLKGVWGVGRYTANTRGEKSGYLDTPSKYQEFSWLCQDITLVPANTKVSEKWTKHRAGSAYTEGYTYNAASRVKGDTIYIDNYFDYGQNAAFVINRDKGIVTAVNQVVNVQEDSKSYYVMADLNGNNTVVGAIVGDGNNIIRFTNFSMLRVSGDKKELSDEIVNEATIVTPFNLLLTGAK
jgi:hypothetical protein